MTRTHVVGFLMVVLPLGWLAWEAHHDPCYVQGEAWAECSKRDAKLPVVGYGY